MISSAAARASPAFVWGKFAKLAAYNLAMLAAALLAFIPICLAAHSDFDNESTNFAVTHDVPGFAFCERKPPNAGFSD
jgi:hypothetical protein